MSRNHIPARVLVSQLLLAKPWLTINEMVQILVKERATSTNAAVRTAVPKMLEDRALVRQRDGLSYKFALAGEGPLVVLRPAGEAAPPAAAAGQRLSPMAWTAQQLLGAAC